MVFTHYGVYWKNNISRLDVLIICPVTILSHVVIHTFCVGLCPLIRICTYTIVISKVDGIQWDSRQLIAFGVSFSSQVKSRSETLYIRINRYIQSVRFLTCAETILKRSICKSITREYHIQLNVTLNRI